MRGPSNMYFVAFVIFLILENFFIITFSGLEKGETFELIMLSESIFEELKPMLKAAGEINYEDDQVYENVDGYESLRKIFKKKVIKNHILKCGSNN